MPDDSLRTVLVALGSGLGVALAWPLTSAAHRDREVDDSVTQPLGPAEEERIRAFLLGYPGVTAIREVFVTFVGPGRAWVIARLDIDDDLRGGQVQSLVSGIESGMKRESEGVYRVDVVPMAEHKP